MKMTRLRRQQRRVSRSLKLKSSNWIRGKRRHGSHMANVFEGKTSQGHTRNPPPMRKNVCVSQSFRSECLQDIDLPFLVLLYELVR